MKEEANESSVLFVTPGGVVMTQGVFETIERLSIFDKLKESALTVWEHIKDMIKSAAEGFQRLLDKLILDTKEFSAIDIPTPQYPPISIQKIKPQVLSNRPLNIRARTSC